MLRGDATRRHARYGSAVALAVAIYGASPVARAGDTALAETLFQEARSLMASGMIAEACAKFAESQRLDPATGTLLNLAACRQAEGKLASAWADFKAAEASARRDGREDRVRFARGHLAAIEPQLSYLTVQVAPANRVAGLEVRLDGVMIREAAWGVATPVDAGSHEVTATAPGRLPFRQNIKVTQDDMRLVVDIRLAPAPAAGAATPDQPAAKGTNLRASPSEDTGAGVSPLGLITGGLGVTGLAVGTIFGLKAYSQWAERNRECPLDVCNTDKGVKLGNDAARSATIADVAFAVGVAGVGLGSYLLFFRDPPPADGVAARARPSLTPVVSSSSAAVVLGGSW